jgi:hypothetical protein
MSLRGAERQSNLLTTSAYDTGDCFATCLRPDRSGQAGARNDR